ncbi:MAG: 50S ribosomal protein L32 [Candidatus Berkelbacteria bacterium]|nr:50S ribosomal protein L32 [Candidatus Berkelbacteria bacterium]
MAEPKKKNSKARTRKRRHQIKFAAKNLNYCEKCQAPKLGHQVCYNCGTYRGNQVISNKTKSEISSEISEK